MRCAARVTRGAGMTSAAVGVLIAPRAKRRAPRGSGRRRGLRDDADGLRYDDRGKREPADPTASEHDHVRMSARDYCYDVRR